jgi:hypothetical protein
MICQGCLATKIDEIKARDGQEYPGALICSAEEIRRYHEFILAFCFNLNSLLIISIVGGSS